MRKPALARMEPSLAPPSRSLVTFLSRSSVGFSGSDHFPKGSMAQSRRPTANPCETGDATENLDRIRCSPPSSATHPRPPAASRATVAAHDLQLRGNSPGNFRAQPYCPCRWLLTVIAVMAGLLLIVSTTEPGRYVYLKYGVARKKGDVILDRRKEDRRRNHQAAATAERRYGDRRHRDITRELKAFGWAVAHQ